MHGTIRVSFQSFGNPYGNGILMTTLHVGSPRNTYLQHVAFSYYNRLEQKTKYYETRSFDSRFKYKKYNQNI